MRFSLCTTLEAIRDERDRRLLSTHNKRRRLRIERAAWHAELNMLGIALPVEHPNPDDAMAEGRCSSLDELEARRWNGQDGDEADERLKPITYRSDNCNPADLDYDEPGFFLVRGDRGTLLRLWLTPSQAKALVRVATADCGIPIRELADPPAPLPEWREPAQRTLPEFWRQRLLPDGYSKDAESVMAVMSAPPFITTGRPTRCLAFLPGTPGTLVLND